MRIEPRETLASVPMLRIRELLRWMRGDLYLVSATNIASFLNLNEQEGAAVIAELLQRQMIVLRQEPSRDKQYYQLTSLGGRVAAATGNKPLKRATAERLLSEFQARIEPINEEEYFLYRVARVVLFGSYLTDALTLGDIDLIVHLEPKESDDERHKELCIERNEEFISRGWGLSWTDTYALYETMPQREVFVALRKRSSYLSLHRVHDEVVIEHQPHKVIYGPEEYAIPDTVREMYGAYEEGGGRRSIRVRFRIGGGGKVG